MESEGINRKEIKHNNERTPLDFRGGVGIEGALECHLQLEMALVRKGRVITCR